MIKVDIEDLDKITRLTFTSNNPEADQDTLDRIGALILSTSQKRGSYTPDKMQIDVRK